MLGRDYDYPKMLLPLETLDPSFGPITPSEEFRPYKEKKISGHMAN
jgi:hypothetical protein